MKILTTKGSKEKKSTSTTGKFKVTVNRKGYRKGVSFSIDQQTFQLQIEDDPEQPQMERFKWYARQLRVALKRLQKEGKQ